MIETLIESSPYFLLGGWAIFSIWYIRRAKISAGQSINKYIFDAIPQVFPTLGILCTFMGIAWGLNSFDANKAEETLPELMKGLSTAFYGSIGGVILLIIFQKITAQVQKGYEKGQLSDETIALNKIIVLLGQMKEETSNNFTYSDENNNQVKPANVFRDIYQESKKQSLALQSFSTDLANTITAGFEKLETQQNSLDTIPLLKELKHEIAALGSKLQDPTTEMTQNVVKDLEAALERMVQEFKMSVSGSAKAELETLATLLSQAGGSLTDFPKKLEEMTNNLNENFKGLQTIVQQISQQTLSQSTESTDLMKKQVEEMSKILTTNVGALQTGQKDLMVKQTENLTVSDKLLSAFNNSIEKMNGLSDGVNETIKKFDKVQTELNIAAGHLKSVSDNVNISTDSFKKAQFSFSEQSNNFLFANKSTIDEIQNSLIKAKEVSADYAQKFTVIEKGLQSIFDQIQSGLNGYSKTIGSSLESYLGEYSKALNSTVESLAGQSSKHEEILDELTEQLSKLNARKN